MNFPIRIDVKYLSELKGDRAIVWITRHKVLHMCPPFFANCRSGYRRPLPFIFDFRVTEELPALRVEKD